MHCSNSINTQILETGAANANPKYAPAAANSTVANNVRPAMSLANFESSHAISDNTAPPIAPVNNQRNNSASVIPEI